MVIPLKWAADRSGTERVDEMATYLREMRDMVASITVVDGSEEAERELHERVWGSIARIVPPDPDLERIVASPVCHGCDDGRPAGRNGKVIGAVTGIRLARHEAVVLADDDVRHDAATITALVAALDQADLVRPVNVYDAWPWQARWDGARSLLNQALATDWPGTFALRRSSVLATGGWCPHVLFENLELWRTVQASGGHVRGLPEVRVARTPPSSAQFWSQRVRQAYDDFAQPVRLALELAIVPVGALVALTNPIALPALALASVAVASVGRRRVGSDRVPPSVPLWTPVWLLERGVCVWLALASRLRGGVRYHGLSLHRAAHSPRRLRRVLSGAPRRGTAAPAALLRADGAGELASEQLVGG